MEFQQARNMVEKLKFGAYMVLCGSHYRKWTDMKLTKQRPYHDEAFKA